MTELTLAIGDTAIDVHQGDRLAGRYVYDDPFKPHLHPLCTPRGHTLTLKSPHDHPHHRGLMYALRTQDVNFWEERSTREGEAPGRQRHERFTTVIERGSRVGVDEAVTWLPADGGPTVFRERRSLACAALDEDRGYEWTWSTELEAERDLTLIMSQWSAPRNDGTLVNYHGLGIRLRRDFGCTGGNALYLDGVETTFADGMGTTPTEAAFHGSIDGTWPVARAGVALRQSHANALFALQSPFAFLSLGPTNLAPRTLSRGDRLVERYVVRVFDLPT